MSPNKRKSLLSHLRTTHLSLGCSCGPTQPNLLDIHHPKPKPRPKPKPISSSSSSNDGKASAATTFSPAAQSDEPSPNPSPSPSLSPSPSPSLIIDNKGKKKVTKIIIEDSVAVVKESKDPYEDFRVSMLQMIFQTEISSTDDLHRLLHRFLRLNSPLHHDVIFRAFMDICNGLIVSSTPNSTP